MTHGFQQQGQTTAFAIPKSAPSPQHGEKATAKASKIKKPRSIEPRPGH